jgi:hypothetical protein
MTANDGNDACWISTDTLEMSWDAARRVARARVVPGAKLGAKDGADLVGAVARWTEGSSERFAVLADGGGGHETDGKYRATLSSFIRQHRDKAFVTFFNLGAVLPIVVEMFRVGTGIPMHAFATEEEARAWLRTKSFDV